MPTNTPSPRPDHDRDNVAAVPVAEKRPFNWLFLTPLLLLLLLIPFCSRRDTTADRPVATATPAAVASPAASVANRAADAVRDTTAGAANATRNATANTADALRNTGTAFTNPFTVNATGRDAGKAVLNFDANATTPNPDATGVLSDVAAYLKANPAARASLRGYTDNSGAAETNRRLTQQRIEAVKTALATAGVDAGRIATANFGEAYPVTDNASPQAREMNRRVEVELVK